jgi:uncharacterized membrane protein YozB (DUF420 family)
MKDEFISVLNTIFILVATYFFVFGTKEIIDGYLNTKFHHKAIIYFGFAFLLIILLFYISSERKLKIKYEG